MTDLFMVVGIVMFILGVLLLLAVAIIGAGLASGFPVGSNNIDFHSVLPDENLPLVVKMGYLGKDGYYTTVTPYNKEYIVVPIYYRIPMENLENFGDIKPGDIIINDNGILKKFPITLEV